LEKWQIESEKHVTMENVAGKKSCKLAFVLFCINNLMRTTTQLVGGDVNEVKYE